MASEPVGVVVGLRAEARIARRLGWPVAVGGGTSAGATSAARALADRGVAALLSFGLAGGLDPALPAGALVVPRGFLLDGERVASDPALVARLGGATCDLLLCGASVVATAAVKARLFAETGACAIDLETGPMVRVARERGIPAAALRAVCDPAERDLPPAALVALSDAGGIGLARVAGSVLRHPGQLPALLALGRDAAKARRALLGVAPSPSFLPLAGEGNRSPFPACGLGPRSGSRPG